MAKKFLSVLVEFPTMPQQLAKLGVDENGDVQDRLTDLVVDNLKDFMPKRSGRLIAGMAKKSPTFIKVEGPYARFLFFGVTRTGKPVDYSTSKNPNAGPNWDRRMVAARGEAIVADLNRYVKRRRRKK